MTATEVAAPAAPSVTLTQIDAFRFVVDFGSGLPALNVDEAPPAGGGDGPFPEQLLISGVANCLCASMVFALGKFKQNARGVSAKAGYVIGRNEEGRLRVHGIEVSISLGAPAAEMDRIERVIDQFERFCTVSESVKAGVPVTVQVTDGEGRRLK